jgi:hypothetical protein
MRAFYYDSRNRVMMLRLRMELDLKQHRNRDTDHLRWRRKIKKMSIEEVLSLEKNTRTPQISVLIVDKVIFR